MICETRELYVCAEVRCLKVNTKQSLSASEIYDVGFDIEVERAGVIIRNNYSVVMRSSKVIVISN